MMDAWEEIDRQVVYPPEDFRSFADYVRYHNANYPANAASWSAAREADWLHQVSFDSEGKLVYRCAAGIGKARETMFAYSPEFSKITAPVLSIFPMRGERYYVLPFMKPEQQAQMIAFYHAAQLPYFQHCVEQFRRAVPHAKIVELPNSHTYFFITDAERVYQEMRAFLQDTD